MKHIYFLISLLITVSHAERPEKPNIVFILTDDLGWQDVGCYDIDEKSPMETPNMDQLATKGVKFLQGYSPAPTCAPTRCAILSGMHPARTQKTHVVGGAPPTPYGKNWKMMAPWYSGRMPVSTYTLAEALQDGGYETGHVGKWHIAINHHSFPQPDVHGFDWSKSNLGVTRRMKPNRIEGFATKDENDPFKIDENEMCTDQMTQDALDFMNEKKDKPFFLYLATWLVHTPIQTRNERLLKKYCEKLGVEVEADPSAWSKEGQSNPFYCAMVEELDYYIGKVLTYLEETEDPRWKGHKLSENTYVVLTSDNGGMEKHPGEIITDNYPLDRGKISIMEGGTRVPLIITGPEIPKGVTSDVMINGLDFYPTFLSWAGAKGQSSQTQDGLNLSQLLAGDPTDASLVKEHSGEPRSTMMWHFPNSVALESSIRLGGYKLIKNYNHIGEKWTDEFELYELYDKDGKRRDIEEAKNLAPDMPEKVKKMAGLLEAKLESMKASYPYYNPRSPFKIPHIDQVPVVNTVEIKDGIAVITFTENGAKVKRVDLIYTLNAGAKDEEWFRAEATLKNGQATIMLPEGTTNIFFNVVDENQFLVSYPELPSNVERGMTKPSTYSYTIH